MKLKEYLVMKNLNVQGFAIQCGCSFATIYRLLRNNRLHTIELGLKIEQATDGLVTIKELLEEKNGK